MKHILLLLTVMALAAGCNQAGNETAEESDASSESNTNWLTNFEESLKVAAEQKKPVLLNFTGSDWCPPCKQLKRDVFSTAEFKQFADENLVLVELDFPRAKSQPDEVKRQNQELQQRFQIEGYPTVILLSPDGKEVKRNVGYLPGGPSKFTEWARL